MLEPSGQPEVWAAIGTSAATFLVAAATAISSHKKGKTRDHASNSTLTRIENGLHAVQRDVKRLSSDVGELRTETREVRAFVVGPDGENGIRGDVRELKETVKEIEKRERERMGRDVGAYQPPRSA